MPYRKVHLGDLHFRVDLALRQHGVHDDTIIVSIKDVLGKLGVDYGNQIYFPKPHPVDTIEKQNRLLWIFVGLAGEYRHRKPLFRALAVEFGEPTEAQCLTSYVERFRERFFHLYDALRHPSKELSREEALKVINIELELNNLELTQRLYFIFGTESEFAGRIVF